MKAQRISTLIAQELETVVEDGDQAIDPTLDLTLVVDRFYIFAVCVSFGNRAVAITQELKQLITVITARFYCTIHRLSVMDSTSIDLEDVRRRYNKAFPDGVDFRGLPSRHSMIMIDALIGTDRGRRAIWHGSDRPSDHEHIQFARDISQLAQVGYQQRQLVPKWTLDFALNSLSLDPLPSAPVIADCLAIVAVNLGCSVSDIATLDERYASSTPISIYLLTEG